MSQFVGKFENPPLAASCRLVALALVLSSVNSCTGSPEVTLEQKCLDTERRAQPELRELAQEVLGATADLTDGSRMNCEESGWPNPTVVGSLPSWTTRRDGLEHFDRLGWSFADNSAHVAPDGKAEVTITSVADADGSHVIQASFRIRPRPPRPS